MKCRLFFKRENSCLECLFSGGSLISDILLENGVVPDTVIVYKDGVFVPEDERAEEAEYVVVTTASRG